MTNSADPETALDLHCLQRHGISGFICTRVKSGIIKNENNFITKLSVTLVVRRQRFALVYANNES